MIFMFFWVRNFIFKINCTFPWFCWLHDSFTHINWCLLMICFHEIIWALLLFEYYWLCDFQSFMDIFLFYSLLEGFRTSLQVYHKTSCVFFIFGRVFNCAKTIFKLFENPYPSKGGWLGDHALYAILKINLNMCMKWW